MPQHKSAIKRVRQNEKRRIRNRVHRSKMRTMIKQLQAMEDPKEAAVFLNEVKAKLDRLASKKIIHKNQAANYKSALEKKVTSAG